MLKMIIVIKNQLKELNQQYKKLLVKTLLALLLLIPSLSWEDSETSAYGYKPKY